MAVLDELLVGLGFEYDDKAAEQFKKDLDASLNLVKSLAKVATAAAVALTGIATASTAASDAQGKLSKEIGVAVDDIDAYQFALKRAGGSAEGMTNTLRTLSVRAAETARGVGSGIEAFGILGIEVQNAAGELRPVTDLMLEVSQQLQGLDKAKQIELADKLGIRDSILLLQEGPAAIKGLVTEAKALGTTSAEDAAIAAEFQDALVDLWRILKDIGRTITREVAPVLTGLIHRFTAFWKTSRDLINQKFHDYFWLVVRAIKATVVAVGAFVAISLVDKLFNLSKAALSVAQSFMTMNKSIMQMPQLLLGVIALVGLLAEDAKVFLAGGNSMFGELSKRFPEYADFLKLLVNVFATVADVAMLALQGWGELLKIIPKLSFESITDFIREIPGFLAFLTGFDRLIEAVPALGVLLEPIQMAFETIADTIMLIVNGWKGLYDVVGGFSLDNIGSVVDNVPGFIKSFFKSPETQTLPAGAVTSNTSNKSTRVDKVEIRVDGAGANAQAISQEVYNLFQQTAQDLDSPVGL